MPGRPIDEVAREIGMSPAEIIKLASNESPEGPFPGVLDALASALREVNRYPDNDLHDLSQSVAAVHGIAPENLWFGAGSTSLLAAIGEAVGGTGSSAVYAWPSFVMYRIVTRWASMESIEVPLDTSFRHDLEAMAPAVRGDTNLLFVCNPNNPTGTIVPADEIAWLIDTVPESVLVVIDEAYHHFVTDVQYKTSLDHALSRPNVLVLRTFSKVYALAGLRIGYAVGDAGTIMELRKAQPPFTVSEAAQVAAMASLESPGELQRRVSRNAAGRHHIQEAFEGWGIEHSDSQANFVFFRLDQDSAETADRFLTHGVIVRAMGGWLRVTIGSESENARFLEVLEAILTGA